MANGPKAHWPCRYNGPSAHYTSTKYGSGLRPLPYVLWILFYWTIEGWPFGPARHGLMARRAIGPCSRHWALWAQCRYKVISFWVRAGPFGPSPHIVQSRGVLTTALWASGLYRVRHGTTLLFSLRNCCKAAIRYENSKVVPLENGLMTSRPVAFGHWREI